MTAQFSIRPIRDRPVQQLGIPGAAAGATVLGAVVVGRVLLPACWVHPQVAAWATVFTAVCIQAVPFVVLGVAASALLAAVPMSAVVRWSIGHPRLAVPAAALAGVALPGCECGAVPVAATLHRRGMPPGAAVAFMLAAPALNPVVLAATAVAFPGRPGMVVARGLASAATAVAVGWWWRAPLTVSRAADRHDHEHGPDAMPVNTALRTAVLHAGSELARSLGLLAAGAAAAATLIVAVPRGLLAGVAGHPVLGVVAMAVLAVLLAVCSTADAFVASSLGAFSATAQLAFMVVGPAVDAKLAALQCGTFGGAFARRYLPAAFCCAVLAACVTGAVLT